MAFLQKMVGVSNKKELGQLDTLLPLNPSSDVWREALPVTKITDSMYPFDDGGKRPTVDEVRCTLLSYNTTYRSYTQYTVYNTCGTQVWCK